jgi:hypothetical protein
MLSTLPLLPHGRHLSVIVPYRPTCADICLPIRYLNELFGR